MHTWRFRSLAASTFPFALIAQAARKKKQMKKKAIFVGLYHQICTNHFPDRLFICGTL